MEEFLRKTAIEIRFVVQKHGLSLPRVLLALEREVIRQVMQSQGNPRYPLAGCSKVLGIATTTLHMKMVRFGLRRKSHTRLGVKKDTQGDLFDVHARNSVEKS